MCPWRSRIGHPRRHHRRHPLPSRRCADVARPADVGDRRQPRRARQFWGARARELAGMIGDEATTSARMRALETALCRMAPDLAPPPPDMGFVFNALKTKSAGPGMRHHPRPARRQPANASPPLRGRVRLRPEDARSHPPLPAFSQARAAGGSTAPCRARLCGRLCRPGASDARGAAPVRLLAGSAAVAAWRLIWPFCSRRRPITP